jgi:mono/diheme cytochrome c family protein
VTLLLGACGQGNSGDPPPASAASAITGPNSFLLFPNPQVQTDGSLQTNTTTYAQAYYAAIDPANTKDTLAKWKAANGFDTGTGTEATVVFGDARDLGFGRRITVRQNVDGTIATMVENYQVTTVANYGFTSLNVDAAVVQDSRWLSYVNAIEYSPGSGGGVSFVKFFNFNAVTGQRELAIDLDGRGDKAMPGPCITCHGGRGDPLTPPDATGKPLFPLVANSASQKRGDALAHLMPLEADSFQYSTATGFTRADQEAALKILNKMVLCSYPRPAATAFPEDACRRAANGNEWQGTAAALIKAAYGGDGLPNPAYSDTFVPTGWSSVGQTALYQSVVVPACRICHLVRGTGSQSDIDFNTYAKWLDHADRTKAHVIDRGNMPLAKIVFDTFWSTSMADTLATFLEGQGFTVRDAAGAVLRPGRPVADPGPDRTVQQGATALSAAGSLYSSSYNWSIVSGPNGATPATNAMLANPNTVQPTFNATADGTYVLQLVASNGTTQSAPVQLALVVNNALAPPPSTIRFSDIKNVVQSLGCIGCHAPGSPPPVLSFANIDRNGDGIAGDATDDLWFYTELRGRINFSDIIASPLLRKPSGKHHRGGLRPGFDTTAIPGQAARVNYDLFLNWILNGAPQ